MTCAKNIYNKNVQMRCSLLTNFQKSEMDDICTYISIDFALIRKWESCLIMQIIAVS